MELEPDTHGSKVMVSLLTTFTIPDHVLLVRFGETGGVGVKENRMSREGRNFILSLVLKKVIL